MYYFLAYDPPFLTDEMSQASCYSMTIFIENVDKQHYLVPPVQAFTAKTFHAVYTVANHIISFIFPW